MQVTYGFEARKIIAQGRTTGETIERLRKSLQGDNVPRLTDEQCALFLLACNNDVPFAQKTIQNYYTARNDGPELFNNRDLERDDLIFQLHTVEFCIFPQRTDDGCAIIFHRLFDSSYSNYNMEPSMKLLFMSLDAVVYDDPPKGLIILFDMKGVGLMHLTRVRLGLVRKFFTYLQEGLAVQLRRIHVLNSVYFMDKVMAIISPFMKKEVMQMVHFHPPTLDMDLFYEKWLPKKCLPIEFGGDLPSVRDLHEENTEKLREMKPFFDAEEMQRTKFFT